MKERWFVMGGLALFDHETHRFWHRNQIKELGCDLWVNTGMDDICKHPSNKDLSYLLKQELSYYSDVETYKLKFWDDEGRWELVEVPFNIGFGIIEGDQQRFIELLEEYKESC